MDYGVVWTMSRIKRLENVPWGAASRTLRFVEVFSRITVEPAPEDQSTMLVDTCTV